MKKFTKVMLIIAGTLAAIGLVCVAAAFGMGIKTSTLAQMAKEGRFSIGEENNNISKDENKNTEKDTDINNNTNTENNANTENNTKNDASADKNYEIKETFQDLDIEFAAGVLEIRYADVTNVQVQENGISNLRINVRENTLEIEDGTNLHINVDDVNDRKLVVLIPNGMKFREVDMEIGASVAEIKDILADEVSITVGAGEADISKITAKQLDLEVGAGKATAVQLSVDKLDVEAGLGEVNVALSGVQEDYNYSVECGIGTVVVGGNTYSGLGAEQNVKYEGATKRIDIECGIGQVKVKFQK